MKERAERHLGHAVHKAVITVPAFFNEVQRKATRAAGELAGLDVVRIINEPTAAALTYDPAAAKLERLLVYDLGGGTFDVSIVQVEQGVVEVLASHGDTRLGGDDFDQLLLDYVCDRFAEEHEIDLRKLPTAKSRVLAAVEQAKKVLSVEAVAVIEEEFIAEKGGAALHLDLEIERFDYEVLIEPLLAKTLSCVDRALTDARLNARQIDKVIMVGGASRTPLVHRLLQSRLGRELHTEVDPDLCVAMGAAIQGGLISGIDVGPVLVDITPHTLGISVLHEDEDGEISPDHFGRVIHRNTPLPATCSEMFATSFDNQKKVQISIYQGESDYVLNNQFIGEFLLEGLAAAEAGNEILVRFNLDLNGILKVTAEEHATGLQKQMKIENAVSRFRRESNQDAKQAARLRLALDNRPAGGGAPASADVPAATDRCSRADRQGARLSGKSHRPRPRRNRPARQGLDRRFGRPLRPEDQAGRSRAGRPGLLSPGRVTPMTERPYEDDFTCPVCRAAQPSSDTCRRCRSDLRMVLRARRAARAARRQALLHLAAGRWQDALCAAPSCTPSSLAAIRGA